MEYSDFCIVNESVIPANIIRLQDIKDIVKIIYSTYLQHQHDEKAGNQNCMLCTWATECRIRGENVLPRPVYSPRDIIFSINGYDIVSGAFKQTFQNKSELITLIQSAGNGARFYTHVNWTGSKGGHEFILINIEGEVYLIDSQDGKVAKSNDASVRRYFNDINYKESYIVRMDDKPLNKKILQYNDKSYITHWNDTLDIAYLEANNMISD